MKISKGYVIEKRPANDTDAFVKIVSPEGVSGFIVPRGSHRSSDLAAVFTPFTLVNGICYSSSQGDRRVVYDHGSYEILPYGKLQDEARMRAVRVLFTAFSSLSGPFDSALFDIFENTLRSILFKKDDPRGIMLSFMLSYLETEGIFPESERCFSCGKKSDLDFFSPEGGIICVNCAASSTVRPAGDGLIRLLKYAKKNPRKILEKTHWKDEILEYYGIIKEFFDHSVHR